MGYFWNEHTFIICAYNESPYLEACIRSLLGQTIKSRLLIATSTPNEKIRRLAKRYEIELLVNQGDKGIAKDWNFAYEKAATPYVTLAHQDDIYSRKYTKVIHKAVMSAKEPLLLFTDYYELRGDYFIKSNLLLKIKRMLLAPLAVSGLQKRIWIRRRILAFGNSICCPSVTYVKQHLEPQVFKPGFRSNVDWEAWERISRKKGAFIYIPLPLVAHRIHKDSETSAVIRGRLRLREDYKMFCKFWPANIAGLMGRIYEKSEKSNTGDYSGL